MVLCGALVEIKEYCETLAANNPELIIYKVQKANLGLVGNWNALVSIAIGEFVFIPGDDDLISQNFLEKMITKSNMDADVIFCNQRFIDHKGSPIANSTVE